MVTAISSVTAQRFIRIDSSVVSNFSSNPSNFVVFNGICYFGATNHNTNNNDLWRTDGTPGGTYMISDSTPVTKLTVMGNKVHINNQWVIDSSGAIIKELYVGSQFNFKGHTYYVQYGIVRDDGVVVYNNNYSLIHYYDIAITGNYFVFTIHSESDYEDSKTYFSDGTREGTVFFDVPKGNTSLTSLNNKFYFIHNNALYRNNGSPEAGSSKLIYSPISLNPYNSRGAMPVVHNTLFFTNSVSTALCKYDDGGPDSVVVVKTIYSLDSQFEIDRFSFAAGNNILFFAAYDGKNNMQLWKSDGTAAGTVLLKQYNAPQDKYARYFTLINDTLYFAAVDNAHGNELWKTDGTPGGTMLVKDINSGLSSATPAGLAAYNNGVIFAANDGTHGNEPWFSGNGETGMVKDADSAQVQSVADASQSFYDNGSLYHDNYIIKDNHLFFSANDNVHGSELWISDGTAQGTKLVKDIVPGTSSSSPTSFITANNEVYFTAGNGIWKTDGTNAGTILFYQFSDSIASKPGVLRTSGNGIFYFVQQNTNSYSLVRTDGTKAGTYIILNASLQQQILYPVIFGNKLCFRRGTEIWVTDGTLAGTYLSQDPKVYMSISVFNNKIILLQQGYYQTGGGSTQTSSPIGVFDNKFYYSTSVYDRVEEGPIKSFINWKDTLGNSGTFNDIRYVSLRAVYKNRELYSFLPGGSNLVMLNDSLNQVKILNKNIYIYDLAEGGDTIYFKGNTDMGDNYSIGYTDGTYTGSQFIQDSLVLGETQLLVVNNHIVVYVKGKGIYSMQLTGAVLPITQLSFTAKLQNSNGLLNWSTATEQNSDYFAVQRSTDGLHFSNIGKVAAAGNSTYRQEYDYTDYKLSQYGVDKLYYRLKQFDKDGKFTYSKIVPLSINTSFTASISPIPVANQLNVNVASAKKQTVLITVVDMSGKTIASYSKAVEAGGTTLSYNAAGWAKGLYQVHITQANGNKQTISVVR